MILHRTVEAIRADLKFAVAQGDWNSVIRLSEEGLRARTAGIKAPSPRTLILSAYGQGATDCFENQALTRLVGRFEDEFKPWEKALYEEEGEGGGDLWYAEWDEATGTLSSDTSSHDTVSVRFRGCMDPVRVLLPALQVLLDSVN